MQVLTIGSLPARGPREGSRSILTGDGETNSAGYSTRRHYEKNRLAHISTHLFDDVDCEW